MDWKAEADRRTREVEMTYKVQMDLRAEIERLRAALSDVATFVSPPRPAAMSELDWAYCNLNTMQSYAREALNEQLSVKPMTDLEWEIKNGLSAFVPPDEKP